MESLKKFFFALSAVTLLAACQPVEENTPQNEDTLPPEVINEEMPVEEMDNETEEMILNWF